MPTAEQPPAGGVSSADVLGLPREQRSRPGGNLQPCELQCSAFCNMMSGACSVAYSVVTQIPPWHCRATAVQSVWGTSQIHLPRLPSADVQPSLLQGCGCEIILSHQLV